MNNDFREGRHESMRVISDSLTVIIALSGINKNNETTATKHPYTLLLKQKQGFKVTKIVVIHQIFVILFECLLNDNA